MTQADSATIVAAVPVLCIVSLLMSEHPEFSKNALSNRRAKVRGGVTMSLFIPGERYADALAFLHVEPK
jgi:hypothetical protein